MCIMRAALGINTIYRRDISLTYTIYIRSCSNERPESNQKKMISISKISQTSGVNNVEANGAREAGIIMK